ncbi:MAG: lipopolysaccharide heptosyltransferase II [Arenicella sp.]|nr:lipopolysaccharide heptosyltransferase II [Arenicella sp.]
MSALTKKYLIIGPSWVGDMVMAQSLFIDLKQRQPECQIDVLAPAWTAALMDRMPEVTELIAGNFNHGKLSLGERIKLAKSLRSKGYSNAILLPNSLKSALVPVVAKIPTRTGYIGEQRWGFLNDIRRLDKQALPMTVQRFVALGLEKGAAVRLVDSIPAPQLVVDPSSAQAVLDHNQLSIEKTGVVKKVLVLCPGAEFGPSKQWPVTHYAEVGNHYLSKGWQVWLLGSDKDRLVCQELDALCGHNTEVLAGKTSLSEAVDLISFASLVVANDSGLMHIAAALQKPLVAVYGSTDPGHTPPLSDNHAIARLALDCSPCFKRECPLQHLDCLRQLKPINVLTLAEGL